MIEWEVGFWKVATFHLVHWKILLYNIFSVIAWDLIQKKPMHLTLAHRDGNETRWSQIMDFTSLLWDGKVIGMATGRIGTGSWVTRTRPGGRGNLPRPAPEPPRPTSPRPAPRIELLCINPTWPDLNQWKPDWKVSCVSKLRKWNEKKRYGEDLF